MRYASVVKIMALLALLLQLVLLVYSLLFLKGSTPEELHVVFLRIALLIGSGMMVIITRYFLKFFVGLKRRGGILLIQLLSLAPAYLIPVGGFLFAYKLRSGEEYLLFFLIGLYHLVRYYSPILKMGGNP